MNKQAVLDELNSLEVFEQDFGEDAYILVKNTEEVRSKLVSLGVTEKEIYNAGDDETFCILALAFNGEYATDFVDGKLVWR